MDRHVRATFDGPITQAVDYLYDVEDRWIGEDIDLDGDGIIDEQIRFAYNGTQIILQFEGEGDGDLTADDLSHRYFWQPGVVDQLMADEQVDTLTAPGDVVLTLSDHLGTIRDLAVYDPETTQTTVATHRNYDLFGNLICQAPSTADCLFAFTGRPLDQFTNLQNNYHRWYDANVGGWLTQDLIGFIAGDANIYRYVANSPMNGIDPSGLDRIELLTDGARITHKRPFTGLPDLVQYDKSTVRWIVQKEGAIWGYNDTDDKFEIGRTRTEYKEEHGGVNYRRTNEVITFFPIKLNLNFGGGEITYKQLEKATKLVWKLTKDKGLDGLSSEDQKKVIRVIIALARNGKLNGAEVSDETRFLTWLASNHDRLYYGIPREESSINTPGGAMAESIKKWATTSEVPYENRTRGRRKSWAIF